ncbi:EAL domain-containing protein [Salinibius halmophilus]|uniref:EAL domain-containing protein n=1 Tax=Salinibius halmophilus TaxID=1853216 RepID=UPI001F3F62F6|nr:EAL domain-containing protein [Salinibius halmophilus]
MAFQPIVRVSNRSVFAYEALVRGPNQEGAGHVLAQVNEENRYRFDQNCRVKAIELASQLGITEKVSINFLPRAVYQPASCIHTTVQAAEDHDFPLNQIMFELTESEALNSIKHIKYIVDYYHERGFTTAIDDFGAGYSGLNMLAQLKTDIVKLDMALVRDIDSNATKQIIVRHTCNMMTDLGITVLAEGIETVDEFEWLKALGVDLMQGYLFAKPGFECLPNIDWPTA